MVTTAQWDRLDRTFKDLRRVIGACESMRATLGAGRIEVPVDTLACEIDMAAQLTMSKALQLLQDTRNECARVGVEVARGHLGVPVLVTPRPQTV